MLERKGINYTRIDLVAVASKPILHAAVEEAERWGDVKRPTRPTSRSPRASLSC